MTRPETIAAIRFGYGFHPNIRTDASPEAMLHGVTVSSTQQSQFPTLQPLERRALVRKMVRLRRAKAGKVAIKEHRRAMRAAAMGEGLSTLFQQTLSPHGFAERMLAFWSDHFSVGFKNAGQMVVLPTFAQEALRPNLADSFENMLVAAVLHPSMLTYLDQVDSIGPNSTTGKRRGRGLNENLAREVLELHTLGVGGGYTQADVRNVAKLLTGHRVNRRRLEAEFDPHRAEPGNHRVLERSYDGNTPSAETAKRVLNDISQHPATAAHISRKLAAHFVSDTPPQDLVRHLTSTWKRSGGDLMAVYGALLDHPGAWAPIGAKVRRPQELVVATLRAFGLDQQTLQNTGDRDGLRLVRALRDLGQPLFRPPGPQGWPEAAEAWITPQGLAARMSFASRAAQWLSERSTIDPRAFAEVTLGDTLRPDTAFVVSAAPDRWEGLALTLASPEFQRR